jgi:hypothetical protein
VTNTLVSAADTFGLTESGTMPGVSPLMRRQYSPARLAAMQEADRLLERTFGGDIRASVLLREALSTSDLFKSATGDVLDQQLLAAYSAITPQWSQFATRTTVRNFKPKRMVDILGGRSTLDRVPELDEYPGSDYKAREYFIKVAKFGRMFGFSWESLINDDLDEVRTIPNAFATAAALTEENAALALVADVTTGAPNTAFFKDYSGDPIPGPNTTPVTGANAPLTQANLQTGDHHGEVPQGPRGQPGGPRPAAPRGRPGAGDDRPDRS